MMNSLFGVLIQIMINLVMNSVNYVFVEIVQLEIDIYFY